MNPLTHRVAYHETDQMGIVHHSNYIRWFEEARDACVRDEGIDYRQIEARGILMPVTDVRCDYHRPARYGELVSVEARPVRFTGVRLRYEYRVLDEGGRLLVTGESGHCFISADTRKPLNLKKHMPEYCEVLSRLVEMEKGDKA